MKPVRLEHEKEFLKRLVLSYWDFDQAKQFANHILMRGWQDDSDEVDKVIHRALNTALLIAYSRPFTHNDKGKPGKVCSLPDKITKVFETDEAALHKVIVGRNGLRNSVYAHSDSEPHELKIRVTNLGGTPLAVPIKHDPFEPLAKAKVKMLSKMIEKLLSRILEEKVRIQSALPIGAQF